MLRIDMEYVNSLMLELLSIPSVGGDCEEAMARVEEEFNRFNISVSRTNKGALIGTMKGTDDDHHVLIASHVDTLGAIVREIKSNGRLKMLQIGGFAWNSVEGENVLVRTMDGTEYSGSILPYKASIHGFSDEVRDMKRDDDSMELRLDELVKTKEDVLNLGIHVGDLIFFQPRAVITSSGFVKSRHLDDKACVALMFGAIKSLCDEGKMPSRTTHFYVTNYEEMGHGISRIPEKVTEFAALDIGIVTEASASEETAVTILAKDSRTPYDLSFRKRLVALAEKYGIDYRVDVHYRYGSDASIAAIAGFDVNFACFGPGVDATHHYERTHVKAIEETAKLLTAYISD
ncbi:MAG: M42 family metallopeptidase [Aminobacterium sp.]|jgi:putative aminopeptidase FrvX|nr:M42 family metallopeptidase [Aminobacterium sp.]MDD3427070.1 M42 family metallopeptidase [Aminobacterium sp.]MDD3707918.1 M42 family metallopeptidase [Aminobacterium sp.]MDD4551980.1 M42 family metallopeptidase [Aminobacterium sp.]